VNQLVTEDNIFVLELESHCVIFKETLKFVTEKRTDVITLCQI